MRRLIFSYIICAALCSGLIKRESVPAKTLMLPSTISEVLTFNTGSQSSSTLFSMPTNCSHGGKIYQQGELWQTGHLRYKCGKFGVYEILGCRTDKDRPLEIGENFVDDHVAHQCFEKDSAVYYRQFICGTLGQPDCDKLSTNLPQVTTAARVPGIIDQSHGLPGLSVAGLPEGWKIVDAQGNPVPLSNIRVISRTTTMTGGQSATFSGTAQNCSNYTEVIANTLSIPKRQSGFGVGSAVLLSGPELESSTTKSNERVVGVGTGSVSLDSRRPTASVNTQGLKPETVAGSRSDVNWSGKTMMIGNKRIAVGPGTFTFGVSPTGAFIKKNN